MVKNILGHGLRNDREIKSQEYRGYSTNLLNIKRGARGSAREVGKTLAI